MLTESNDLALVVDMPEEMACALIAVVQAMELPRVTVTVSWQQAKALLTENSVLQPRFVLHNQLTTQPWVNMSFVDDGGTNWDLHADLSLPTLAPFTLQHPIPGERWTDTPHGSFTSLTKDEITTIMDKEINRNGS